MSQRFTIQLGELRLAKYDLGNKAALLDQVTLKDLGNKGLIPEKFAPVRMPVPVSGVILDEFFRYATEHGLASVADGTTVVIPNARKFMDAIELPPITGLVAVRSAFTSEDGNVASQAGKFATVLNVPIDSFDVSPSRVVDPIPLADAIAQVWTSGLQAGVRGRLDVLVMSMVAAKHSGVAFTEIEYEDDLINYTEGLAGEMLAGREEGVVLELPKLQALETPSKAHNNLAFAPRIQMILRSIRTAMGRGNWDVEWADDGEKTWIIQVRPITVPTIRNEVFTYAPLKESLPELPSRFMATLIEAAGDDIFEMYRDIDATLPRGRKYIEVLYGRPMINLSLMMDMARHWGAPTTTVTWALNERVPNEARANRLRLLRSRGTRFAMRMRAMRASAKSRALAAELHALSENPGSTVSEVIETARLVYARLMRQMLLLRDAMGEDYSSGGRSLGTQMYSDLGPMRRMVQSNPDIALSLGNGTLPRDTKFRNDWEAWLRKHGHRGAYETDLARPRFRENPSEVLQMIAHPAAEAPAVHRSPVSMLAPKSPAAKAARAREELRFDAMIAFERIRRRLLELALPKGVTTEMFFALTIQEAKSLDGGWRPTADFIRERVEENDALAKLRMPDVMRRNDIIDQSSSSLHGIGLTRGEASGRALILRDPVTKLPAGFTPRDTILIAPSVDAGWVPTFGLVSGVVIESGSNLSHGAIILRELGIPAVTNVRGATHAILPGQRVHVVAAHGRVDLAARR
jgi:rifampicin phosphotransferase